jgi:SnoaL-like domain
VCFGDEAGYPVEATVDRYFTPDYAQRTDGETVGRDGFTEHIRALRALTKRGTLTVAEAIADGSRIAGRHQVTVTRRDGAVSRVEVCLSGELAADGRLRRTDELTRVIGGEAGDVPLARVR